VRTDPLVYEAIPYVSLTLYLRVLNTNIGGCMSVQARLCCSVCKEYSYPSQAIFLFSLSTGAYVCKPCKMSNK